MASSHRPRANAAEAGVTRVVLGTRQSRLALIQCRSVQEQLQRIAPALRFDIQPVLVKGDADKTTPFLLMGDDPNLAPARRDQIAKSFWTEELEAKLLSGELDAVVHCLKDLPTTLPPGTTVAAILEREDPRDVLVVRKDLPYTALKDFPAGSVVGTSSTRRKGLIRRLYPHLKVDECRGNMDGRLAKLDHPNRQLSCIIVAAAGMHRVGEKHRITAYLSALDFPYAAGQGSLALQIRTGDKFIHNLVSPLNEPHARAQCLAERSLLRTLQGGCSSPIGIRSHLYTDEITHVPARDMQPVETRLMLRLAAIVVHPHGWSDVRSHARAEIKDDADADAERLGEELGGKLLNSGADELLDKMHELQQMGFRQHFDQKNELEVHVASFGKHEVQA